MTKSDTDKIDSSPYEQGDNIKSYISISLLVFIFVLFFEPFDLSLLNFDNQLLFIAGLSAITFLFLYLFHSISFAKVPGNSDNIENSYLSSLLVVILTSVAYSFYLRYVGGLVLSMFIVFQIVLLCVITEIIFRNIFIGKQMKRQIKLLKEALEKKNEKPAPEKENEVSSIELYSDNRTEKLEISPWDLALIKTADNYIELFIQDEQQLKKKLLRTTLKSIEEQLNDYGLFLRCHRTSMVNIKFVVKLMHKEGSHKLKIKGFDEEIPVSRQYLLRVKETLGQD